jgi:hypothetical protein
MPKHWYCVALVSLFSAGPAFGQEPVTLKWRIEKDKPIFEEMTRETTSIVKVAGSETKTVQKETYRYSWTPIDQDRQGNWRIKQKIEGMKLTQETVGASPVKYDSSNEAANSPQADIYKQFVGVEFIITFDKEMHVTKVEGRDGFLKKLRDANEQVEKLLKNFVTDDFLKATAALSFIAIPAKEMKIGDHWERLILLDMGQIGKYEHEFQHVYKGKDRANRDFDRIEMSGTVKYVKPDPDAVSGSPLKPKAGKVTAQKSVGYHLFDNRKGRVENSVMNLDITTNLIFEIAGTEVNIELRQLTRTTSDFTGGADPLPDVIEPPSLPPCVSYQPCPCRHHRLFWRLRRGR